MPETGNKGPAKGFDGHVARGGMSLADGSESCEALVIDTAKTLLLPAELYVAGAEAEYLRFNGMALAAGEVAVVSEPCCGVVAVMGVDATELRGAGVDDAEGVTSGGDACSAGSVMDSVGVGSAVRVSSPLLRLVEAAAEAEKGAVGEKGYDGKAAGKSADAKNGAGRNAAVGSVNVYLSGDNVYIVVWENGLQMAEVLPDSSVDSLLYYMQVVGRRFALRRFEITVGGERAGVACDALRRYFGNVRIA